MKYKIKLTGEIELEPIEEAAPPIEPPEPPEPPEPGTIINVNGGFEDGTYADQWKINNSGGVEELAKITTDRVYSGLYAMHLECVEDYRCEMSNIEGGPGQWVWYQDWWLGIAMYFDNYNVDPPAWTTLIQAHTVSATDGYSAGDNGWTLHTDRTGGQGTPNDLLFHAGKMTEEQALNDIPSSSAVGDYNPYKVPIAEYDNKWNIFVVNWRHSPHSDGFIKMWHNGSLKVDETGPNVYVKDCAGNIKREMCTMQTGIYKERAATDKRIILGIDDIAIAKEDGSYELVVPKK